MYLKLSDAALRVIGDALTNYYQRITVDVDEWWENRPEWREDNLAAIAEARASLKAAVRPSNNYFETDEPRDNSLWQDPEY